jgi:hypothetical protein
MEEHRLAHIMSVGLKIDQEFDRIVSNYIGFFFLRSKMRSEDTRYVLQRLAYLKV